MEGGDDFVVRRVGLANAQVVADGSGEQMRRLQDVSQGGMQPELAPFANIFSIDKHLPRSRFIEATDQIRQRGFARSRLADNGDVASERNRQIEIAEDIFVAVRIFEIDMTELDVAADWFPILRLRLEAIAVFFDNLLIIRYIRLRLHQAEEPFDVDLRRDQIRNTVDEPADRFHHALRIGHEHGERSHFLRRDVAALPQNDGQRQRRSEAHRRGEQTAQTRMAAGFAPHFVRVLAEFAFHLLFDDERLHRPRPHDAFIEVAGNP